MRPQEQRVPGVQRPPMPWYQRGVHGSTPRISSRGTVSSKGP
ncbi:MAG: hypothetical protein WEB52_16040 [Dehalococcoidia bacterium]